jgi:hypothetical protein
MTFIYVNVYDSLQGRYLTACPVATTGNAKDLSVASFIPIESLPPSAVKNTASISYVLSVEGQGVGEELDCFTLVRAIFSNT